MRMPANYFSRVDSRFGQFVRSQARVQTANEWKVVQNNAILHFSPKLSFHISNLFVVNTINTKLMDV